MNDDRTDRLHVRELEVERIILREPNEGRVRATLEFVQTEDPGREIPCPTIRFTLLDPAGEPALVAQVEGNGDARLSVGHPNCGPAVIVTREIVEVWAGGNVVAQLPAERGSSS
ncbi:MAG: hypothetical protein H6807_15085 [Planctomycetes bacterium]|nr:hypothetical protein [Planctomycetota bacterium]